MSRSAPSSSSTRTIDPRQNTKLNIRLGQTLLDSANSLCSVTFNHKPSQTGSKRNTNITKTPEGYDLTIQDVEADTTSDFRYRGTSWSKDGAYVLTFDGEGQGLVLDKLDSEYAFNLVAAPWEKDAEKLARQYKEVTHDQSRSEEQHGLSISEDEEGLFDETGGEPDPANPYDYRHYLKSAAKQPEEPRETSRPSTPLLPPTRAPRPAKPGNAPKPLARPPKPRTKPAQALRAPPPPRVRLERRASDKRSSPAVQEDVTMADEDDDDDDNGLVIDMGDGYQRKKQKSMLLTPQAPGRPISLRSAAASVSPMASIPSPASHDLGSGYEEDDEEAEAEAGQEEEEEEEDDEIFRNAAPVADEEPAAAPEPPRRQSTWDADTEADLQAELEQALAAGDMDEEMPNAQESEEESEEE